MPLRSPTSFRHTFKNHDPAHIFDLLLLSLSELNRKRIVRLKSTTPKPASLTLRFHTRTGMRSSSVGGNLGEANCVLSSHGGTDLQLSLTPAGSKFHAAMSSGKSARTGLSIVAQHGVDYGERQKIWDEIIKQLQLHVSSKPPGSSTDAKPRSTHTERAQRRQDRRSGSENQPHQTEHPPDEEPIPQATHLLPLKERLELIERLSSLKDRGILSAEEFSEHKRRVIDGS